MLSFWGFLILLFLICFFRHFAILISVDYQHVMGNQQDFNNKMMDCEHKKEGVGTARCPFHAQRLSHCLIRLNRQR